ncbi:MAG: hypothetical protein WCP35_07880 [Verrucomicrobiota bacterium]
MKLLRNAFILVITATLGACGPNKSELRGQVRKIEAEMNYLNSLAQSQRSRMNEADFVAFIGGFAAGYGATSDNGQLVVDGAGVVLDAAQRSSDAQLSLNQIKSRYNQLAIERMGLLNKLK